MLLYLRTLAGVASALGLWAANAHACLECQPSVRSSVYNADFGPTLFVLLLPIFVILAIGAAFHFGDSLWNWSRSRNWVRLRKNQLS